MSFDDLFSDDAHESEVGHTPLATADVDQGQFTPQAAQARTEYVDAMVERNQSVLQAADEHLRRAENIRHQVFGNDEEYDQFVSGVERRLEEDDTFKEKHEQMSAIHGEVVARASLGQTEPHSSIRPQKPKKASSHHSSSQIYIPGQPVQRNSEAQTSRRNHILRKDMV